MSKRIEFTNFVVKLFYGKAGVHTEKLINSLDVNTEGTSVTKKDIKRLLWFTSIIGLASTSMDEDEIRYFIKPQKSPPLGEPPANI
ncbi:MAG: hypothetical protein Fur0011_3290 [Candidatus Microgenomates bacterium]